MKTIATFTSDQFKPFLPEAAQVNPNRYGAELAFWLSRKLSGKGVVTSYPQYEDWGWFIEYITDEGDEYWLCCGNVDGTDNRWHIFIDPKAKSMFGRNKAKLENAARLLTSLKALLAQEDCIVDLKWRLEHQD